MHDSVREELQTKISSAPRKLTIEIEDDIPEMTSASHVVEAQMPVQTRMPVEEPKPSVSPRIEAPAVENVERERGAVTTEFRGARRTSPIVMEFQGRGSAIPDWRLQMQNAVRQRREASSGTLAPPPVERPTLLRVAGSTNAAVAVQTGVVEETRSAPSARVAARSVARRTEEPRQRFSIHEGGAKTAAPKAPARRGVKTFPIAVADQTGAGKLAPPPSAEELEEKLSSIEEPLMPLFDRALDTNKLPAIPRPSPSESLTESSESTNSTAGDFETGELKIEESLLREVNPADEADDIFGEELVIDDDVEHVAQEIQRDTTPVAAFEDIDGLYDTDAPGFEEFDEVDEQEYEEEIDDLAPLTMRFNAGLLDLLVGSFTSILILSPFILSGGQWMTPTGLLAFGLTLAIVMFIYMTASVAIAGRTLGMRVFCLEMIDVEENEYPSFHQAALSASLYLVSLALGGIGFVTTLFNPEKRAMHDLLSGTIIIREY